MFTRLKLPLLLLALLLPASPHAAVPAAAPDPQAVYTKTCNPQNDTQVGLACSCLQTVIEKTMPLESFNEITAHQGGVETLTPDQRAAMEKLSGEKAAVRRCAGIK